MARVAIHESFFEIDGRVRIERGLAIKRNVVASPELLATLHPDYSTPSPAFDDHPVHGDKFKGSAMDQQGQPIVLGQAMAHIDYPVKGVSGSGSYSWFVFLLEDDATHAEYITSDESVTLSSGAKVLVSTGKPVIDTAHPMHGKRWIEHGQFPTLEAADAFALTL